MKDATIEIINNVSKHGNADALEICSVLGYKSVAKTGDFKTGDQIIYVRPDACFPPVEWAEPYRKFAKKGAKRVKAANIRGEWSSGVIIPYSVLPDDLKERLKTFAVGDDVSETLGIYHYEEPTPEEIVWKGPIPFRIPAAGEERFENIQNLPFGEIVDIDLKYDGKSCSFAYDLETNSFAILGKQYEVHPDYPNYYTEIAAKYDMAYKLEQFCKQVGLSLCIRGELHGANVQNADYNWHSKGPRSWAMFSVWLIKDRFYAEKGHDLYFRNVATKMNLPVVEMIEENVVLTPEIVTKYADTLTELNFRPFEGVVVKHSRSSFKIINKPYDARK